MKFAIVAVAALALGGCATGIRVDYASDPPGATLYQDGQPFGLTPTSLTYQPDEAFKGGGCMQLRGTDVKWASGATASISYLSVCASNGWQQHYRFIRPDTPGREIDMNFALQLQRNSIMQQSNAILLQQQLQQPLIPPMTPPPAPVTCTSQRVLNQIQTICR